MLDGPFQASPVESIQCPNTTVATVQLSSLTHNEDSAGTWTGTRNQAIAAFVYDDKKRDEGLWKARNGQARMAKEQACTGQAGAPDTDTPAKLL